MSIKKIVAAASIALVASSSFAGAFDGPYVQLGIGGANTSSSVSNTANIDDDSDLNQEDRFGSFGSIDGNISQGSFNGILSAGYSKSIADTRFNLAANLFYVIGNQKAGSKSSYTTFNTNQGTEDYSQSGNFKLQNTWGISVEPGWNFTESTLGYFKLAWVNSDYKASIAESGSLVDDPGTSNYSKQVNGFGYGIGMKHLLTENVFLGVDVLGVSYQSMKQTDIVNARPTQWMGFASIGYKF